MIPRRNFLTYVLLTIVTCGIYSLYFWYKYSEDMNLVCDGDGKITQNYIIVILLSLVTCGIYYYIWIYGIGNRLADNAPRYGLHFHENGSTILLWNILGSFIVVGPLIASYILVNNMNALAERYGQNSGYIDSNDHTQF